MAKSKHEWDHPGHESGQVIPRHPGPDSGQDLDEDGVPSSRPVAEWLDLFVSDDQPDPRATRSLQAVLRFSRGDGSSVFGPGGRSIRRLRALEAWALRLGDPSLASVVARWLPPGVNSSLPASPPPLPSDARPDRPLAVLRSDWTPQGDLVAIDHRSPGDRTLLEVASRGRTWLGPSWTSSATGGRFSRAKPTHWTSGVFADGAEWSYKVGPKQITRSAVLLRGRSMVLLGQQEDGREPTSEVRLALPDGIEASIVAGSRAILLSSGRGKSTARLIPLGLPAHDRPTDLGSIAIEGHEVVVRQSGEGRRRWLPVLICWGRAPTTWRALTVSHRSKACRGDVAVAARVAWGSNDEGLVVYRSLGPPELRAFLGHQTKARFLVGAFTRAGDVRPILKVDA